ncbi:MAG: membrane protein insertion efficiency factor YidD [Acidobacteria bacterium SCN 69-37]|nr:MAG: membrane protein insertion efficiency factor YidD [Acidobacteria bacterium SCN 69-37]
MTIASRVLQAVIHGYQLLLGPFLGGACRFEPSCSTYAMEAIAVHGVWHGLLLSAKRLGRCHPLAAPGFDPVPPRCAHDAHR